MVPLAAFFFLSIPHPIYGQNEQSNNSKLVASFYQWYLQSLLKNENPLFNNKIYEYVDPCTVRKCRTDIKRASIGVEYFTKSHDTNEEWVLELNVHEEISVAGDTSIIPVDFAQGKNDGSPCMIVFIRVHDGKSRIIKVEDARFMY